MTDVNEALPFGDWDIEAVATVFESPWYKRVGRVNPPKVAKLLRDLWQQGADLGSLYAKLQKDTQAQIRDRVYEAEQSGLKIAARVDAAITEMKRSKGITRGMEEIPAYIVMSPAQIVSFNRDVFCDFSASGAISTTRRTYKKLPIVSASGVYGPIVMTEEAFAGFSRQAPELDVRLR